MVDADGGNSGAARSNGDARVSAAAVDGDYLNERNCQILESITDAFLAVDENWRFTYVNPQAEQVLERETGDLIGKVIWEVYPGLAGSDFEAIYRQAARDKIASTVTAYYPDHERWYEVRVYPAANGITIYFRDVSERAADEENMRRVQAETERWKRLYDAILSNTPDLVYVFDRDHRFVYANRVLLEMWGKTWDEAIGKNCLELGYEPWHAAMHDREIETVKRTKQPIRGEVPFSGAFGRRIYDYIFVPVIGANGEVEAIAGTTRDVTDSKQSEAALRESQEVLRLGMSAGAMGAWSRDLQTNEVYWSAELEAIFGVPINTFAGTLDGFYDYVFADDREMIKHEVWTAINERRGYIIEFRYHHASGDLRWVEGRGQAVYADDGTPTKVYGIGIDITARKRHELNHEFLAAVTQELVKTTTPDQIVRAVGERLHDFLNVSMCAFVEVNETADTATINYDWHQADAPSLRGVYALPEFVTNEFLRLAKTGQPIIICDTGDDSRIADPSQFAALKIGAHVNIPLIRAGEWQFSLCVYHEKARQWRADEIELLRELSSRIWARLERAFAELEREESLQREKAARLEAEEASRLKDEFLATVSHELRTPLNAILGWSQMLAAGKLNAETSARALETIYRNAKSQAQLIEDILDVSRIITGKLKITAAPVLIAPIIQSIAESLRLSIEAKNIRLQLRLDFESKRVFADADRIQQVVWNLLSNAIKFTPENGQIAVELEAGDYETTIRVRDNGKGIAPEFLPFVFDRFRQADGSTTRAHGGLGLGLAIVRHIVELHGGSAAVTSDGENKGATFTIKLPLAETFGRDNEKTNGHSAPIKQTESNSAEPQTQPSRIKGRRILLIDDEIDTLEMLAAVLTANQAEVKTRSTARAALAALKDWKPDVIVSDIAMPEENGFSFVKKLRQLPASDGGAIPVVALTACVGIKERTEVLSNGFQMYVPKPIEPSELITALVELL